MGYKGDELPKVLRLFIWVRLEKLANAGEMVELLLEFLSVSIGISLNEILKLGEISGEENASAHDLSSGSKGFSRNALWVQLQKSRSMLRRSGSAQVSLISPLGRSRTAYGPVANRKLAWIERLEIHYCKNLYRGT